MLGQAIKKDDVDKKITTSSFSFETYGKIEKHIKAKFEEFIVMVVGVSLEKGVKV